MSNPAVIKLCEKKIGKSRIYLDDNFGESIHIHIDDYRVDLTVDELKSMYLDVCRALNSLVNIKNFDSFKLDPVFLSHMLWKELDHLKEIKYDKVFLEDMYGPYQSKIYRINESVGVKILKGELKEAKAYRSCNHVGQDDIGRYQDLIDSIKTNGYPYDNNYIIMYGDDNIIRDGQHRASCLYYLYGNIEVPVLRFYFDDYKSPSINRFYNSRACFWYRIGKNKLSKLKASTNAICHKAISRVKSINQKYSSDVQSSHDDYPETQNLFRAK